MLCAVWPLWISLNWEPHTLVELLALQGSGEGFASSWVNAGLRVVAGAEMPTRRYIGFALYFVTAGVAFYRLSLERVHWAVWLIGGLVLGAHPDVSRALFELQFHPLLVACLLAVVTKHKQAAPAVAVVVGALSPACLPLLIVEDEPSPYMAGTLAVGLASWLVFGAPIALALVEFGSGAGLFWGSWIAVIGLLAVVEQTRMNALFVGFSLIAGLCVGEPLIAALLLSVFGFSKLVQEKSNRSIAALVALAMGVWLIFSPTFHRRPRDVVAKNSRHRERLAPVRRAMGTVPAGSKVAMALPVSVQRGPHIAPKAEFPLHFASAIVGNHSSVQVPLWFGKHQNAFPRMALLEGEGAFVLPHGQRSLRGDPLVLYTGKVNRVVLVKGASHLYVFGGEAPLTAVSELTAGRSGPPAPSLGEAEHPYNVLLVVVDTLRADHLSQWGYRRKTTPFLDEMAQRSVHFANSYSQAPWTTPSIGSLMTSKYPGELGINNERAILPSESLTMAEYYLASGWTTGAIISHSFCSADWNFDQGFEYFNQDNVLGHQEQSSPGVTSLAREYLLKEREKPFFLWLHYFDPHFTYAFHIEHDPTPDVSYSGVITPSMRFRDLLDIQRRLTKEDLAQLTRLYDSEITYTDKHIGQVFEVLKRRDLLKNTMVVFTADHGEEFMDHGKLGHGKDLHSELTHVPSFLYCPHWEPKRVEKAVANIDLFSTMLACQGLKAPSQLRGQAWTPEAAGRPVFSQTSKEGEKVSVVYEGFRLISYEGGRFELFDLAADAGELVDLSKDEPERTRRLAQLIDSWRGELEEGAGASRDLDEQERQALEALGYLDK